jgi:hypothetical protein
MRSVEQLRNFGSAPSLFRETMFPYNSRRHPLPSSRP